MLLTCKVIRKRNSNVAPLKAHTDQAKSIMLKSNRLDLEDQNFSFSAKDKSIMKSNSPKQISVL